MPKIVKNVTRGELSYKGLTLRHSQWLNQGVKTSDNVEFNDLYLKGDITIDGNMTVGGQVTVIETEQLKIKDQIIEINEANTDPLLLGGIQVNRGPGLLPFMIVYSENTQSLQAGFQGSLSTVATKQVGGINNGLTIWNASQNRFDISDTVRIPISFTEGAIVGGTLGIGSDANRPFLQSDTAGNLIVTSQSNVVINAGSLNASNVQFAHNTTLSSTQSGQILNSASDTRLSAPQARLSWHENMYIAPTIDHETLRIFAPRMEFNTPNGIVANGSLHIANNGIIQPHSTGIRILSNGNIDFAPNGFVNIPSLSLNNNKVRLSSDVAGNLSIESDGNMTFNPNGQIIVPSSKQLLFGPSGKSISISSNNLVLASDTDIILNAQGRVRFPSLGFGSGASISDNSNNLVIQNTTGNIVLNASQAGTAVVVPSTSRLDFGTNSFVQSNSNGLLVNSQLDIVLDAVRHIQVPVNKSVVLGPTGNVIFGNSSKLQIESQNGTLDLVSPTGVNVPHGKVFLDSASFTVSGGTLTITSQNSTQMTGPVFISSTANGTSRTTSALAVAGSIVAENNIRTLGSVTSLGNANLGNNLVQVNTNLSVVPVTMSSHGSTNGSILQLVAPFDSTTGYIVGRGASSWNGGRSMTFLIPQYSEYQSSGNVPSFLFGNGSLWMMQLSSELANVYTPMTLHSSLNVQSGTSTFSNAQVSQLSVPNSLIVNNSSVQILNPMSVSDAISIANKIVLSPTNATFDTPIAFSEPVVSVSTCSFTTGTFGSISTNNLNLNNSTIQNLAPPVTGTDAATKAYVDEVAQGLSVKESVVAATTTNVNLATAVFNIDDTPLLPGMRILVKDQQDPIENGIYIVNDTYILVRAPDFDLSDTVNGAFTFVEKGTVNQSTGFVVLSSGSSSTVVVGTDNVVWTAFTGVAQIQVGNGINKTGALLSLKTTSDFEFDNGNLQISSALVGTGLTGGSGTPFATSQNQSHVTQLGTIASGTWNASTIGLEYGGTGRTSVPEGSVLFGPPSGSHPLSASDLWYNPSTKRLGIGTTSPSSGLHLVNANNANSIIVQASNPTRQKVSLELQQHTTTAEIAISSNDILQISHPSRIQVFSGNQVPSIDIFQNGQTTFGNIAPQAGHTVSVQGRVFASDGMTLNSDISFVGNANVQAPGDMTISGTNVNISPSNRLNVNSNEMSVANFTFSSLVSSSEITSFNPNTLLPVPMSFKVGPNFTSAIAFSQGFLVPNTLQLGGTVTDPTGGFRFQISGGNLNVIAGSSNASLVVNSNVQLNQSLNLGNVRLAGTNANLNLTGHGSLPIMFDIGQGGDQTIVTQLSNKTGQEYVQFNPDLSKFKVTQGITTEIEGPVKLHNILGLKSSNTAIASLASPGWYYLGTVRNGTLVMELSNVVQIRITFTGQQMYNVESTIQNRNVANLVMYKSPANANDLYLYIRVVSGPVLVKIVETSIAQPFSFSQFEGTAMFPDGTISDFVSDTWTLDYSTESAQASSTLEIGSVQTTGTISGSGLSISGQTSLNGPLNVQGNVSQQGTMWETILPSGSPLMTLENDIQQNSSLTVYSSDTSTASFGLSRGSLNAALSLNSITSLQFPGGLVLNHSSAVPQSQIVLATRNTPHFTLNDQGIVTILTTTDSTGSNNGALIVRGGMQINRRLYANTSVHTPSILLTNQSAPEPVTLSCTTTGTLSVGNKRIANVANPQNALDAVNKSYVDMAVQGTSAKESVIAATVENIDLSQPVTVIDGANIPTGSRILVKNQNNAVQNGIYITVSGSGPVRAADLDLGSNASSVFVFVSRGIVNANSGWLCTSPAGSDIVGVNALSFVQFSGAGQITSGPGIAITGNQINLVVDDQSIELASGALRIKSSAIGTGLIGGSGAPIEVSSIAHLSELGTIHQGTWQANVIGMEYGGTGTTGFNTFRIPFSNGVSLTQGPLVFDSDNIRLGINTTTPAHGLTLVDRNMMISSSSPSHIILTAPSVNYTYALRQSGNQLSIISGTGNNLNNLVSRFAIDVTGQVTLSTGLVTPFASISNVRYSGNAIERTVSGANVISMFSSDNSGTAMRFYGNIGNSSNLTNTEYLNVGHTDGQFQIQTVRTGAGTVQPLALGTGSNPSQILLQTNGNVSMSHAVQIQSTLNSSSIANGGALTVSGGAAFDGTLFAQKLVLTSSDIDALSLSGGLTISRPLLLLGHTDYSLQSNAQLNALDLVSENDILISLKSQNQNQNIQFEFHSSDQDSTVVGYNAQTNQFEIASSNVPIVLGINNPSLVIANSVQIATDFEVTGNVTLTSTQPAQSFANGGALTLAGGMSVAKNMFVGDSIITPIVHATNVLQVSAAGSSERTNMSYTLGGKLGITTAPTANNFAAFQTADHELLVGWDNSTQEYISFTDSAQFKIGNQSSKLTFQNGTAIFATPQLEISGTTESISTSSGSLVVDGGMGVAKNVFIGGSLNVHHNSQNGNGGLMSLSATDSLNNIMRWHIASENMSSSSPTLAIRLSSDSVANSGIAIWQNTNPIVRFANQTTFSVPTNVRFNHVKAFLVQDNSNSDVFSINTVNKTIDLNGCRVINGSAPVISSDLATKAYVDNIAKGLNLKDAVKVTTLSGQNINLMNPLLTLDNVALNVGDRILVKNQNDPIENGIYIVLANNFLTRAPDMQSGTRAAGVFCFIQQGDTFADTGYVCTADFPDDIVGTHNLHFTQFNGNVISAGDGLRKDINNVLHLDIDSNAGLEINGGKLRINPSIAGNGIEFTNGVLNVVPVSELGVITQGIWRATPVEMSFGGTGNSNFPLGGLVFSSGTNLINDAFNLFWNNSKKTLGIGTSNPDPNNQSEGLTMTKDIALYGVATSILFGNPSTFEYNWRIRRDQTNLIFSCGASNLRNSLTNSVIMTGTGQVGIGHMSPGSINDTLDIQGTMHVSQSVTFDTALSVPSGGTGVAQLDYGLVLANGTSAFTSTGSPGNGAVPVGNSSGQFILESGSALRSRLGLAIGTHVQAYNVRLDEISSIVPANNSFVVGNGNALVTLSGSSARSALGLGSLAVLSSINNSNWSGTQLSVSNGGTGSVSFVNNTVPFFDGSAITSSDMYWANNGLGIGTLNIQSSNGVQILGKDIALQAQDNLTDRSALAFHNSNGQYLWTVGRSGSTFVIAGGAPETTKNLLLARVSIHPSTGLVTISNSLNVGQDTFVSGNIETDGIIVVNATNNTTGVGTGSFVLEGGMSCAKDQIVGGSQSIMGSVDIQSTMGSVSATTGALTIAGGLGIAKDIWSHGAAVFDQTDSGKLAQGVTIAYQGDNWSLGTPTIGQQHRGLAIASENVAAASFITLTNVWDMVANENFTFQHNNVPILQFNNGINILTTENSSSVGNGAMTIAGGLSVAKNVNVGGSLFGITHAHNGSTMIQVTNNHPGANANSNIDLVVNSVHGTLTMTPSSLHIESDTAVKIVAGDGLGIQIQESGPVTVDSDFTVASTRDVTSLISGGAMTVAGGMTVAKRMYVGDDLIVAGQIIGTGNTVRPTMVLSNATNVSSSQVRKAVVIRDGYELTLFFNLSLVPTAGDQFASIQFVVPELGEDIETPFDIMATVNGYTSDQDLVSVENIVCVGVPNTRRMILKFQAQDTSAHHFSICVHYYNESPPGTITIPPTLMLQQWYSGQSTFTNVSSIYTLIHSFTAIIPDEETFTFRVHYSAKLLARLNNMGVQTRVRCIGPSNTTHDLGEIYTETPVVPNSMDQPPTAITSTSGTPPLGMGTWTFALEFASPENVSVTLGNVFFEIQQVPS